MIEAKGLTKVYGEKTAVGGVSFTVQAGRVTGFLGPNGAGKSTTMRMIMGLDAPTAGSVTVNGEPFAKHVAPLREIGALLTPRPSIRVARRTTTCWPWPQHTASPRAGCGRSLR